MKTYELDDERSIEYNLSRVNKKYKESKDIITWAKHNQPDEDLYYKSGVEDQVKKLEALRNILYKNIELPKVISYHTSKSVSLPVSAFKISEEIFAIVRDNFYDIKLSIISKNPININYSLMHKLMSEKEYVEEREKCRNYKGDSKDNVKYINDDWMRNWSSNSIIRDDDCIYKAFTVHRVYCEGINKLELSNDLFSVYEKGKQMFTCSMDSYVRVASILETIINNDY